MITIKKLFVLSSIEALIIGLLISVILFRASDKKTAPLNPITVTKYVRDTVPVIRDINVPIIQYQDTGSFRQRFVHDSLPANVLNDLANYYAKRVYKRTLLNDSTATIELSDTLYMNALGRSKLTFINRRPTSVYNTIITPINRYKNALYVGTLIGYTAKNIGAGITSSYVTRSLIYSASYDAVNKGFYGGILLRLGK